MTSSPPESAELENLSDEALFAAAQREGRAVVTENLDDFFEIDAYYRQRGRDHHGLVLTTDRRFHRGAEAHIGQLVRKQDAFLGEDAERAPGWVHWLK
jgi:hypothetical protein